MHNGAYHTLEEVSEHYNKDGASQENLGPNIKPLNLTVQDEGGYCRFLKNLTGKSMEITFPQL